MRRIYDLCDRSNDTHYTLHTAQHYTLHTAHCTLIHANVKLEWDVSITDHISSHTSLSVRMHIYWTIRILFCHKKEGITARVSLLRFSLVRFILVCPHHTSLCIVCVVLYYVTISDLFNDDRWYPTLTRYSIYMCDNIHTTHTRTYVTTIQWNTAVRQWLSLYRILLLHVLWRWMCVTAQ